VRQNEAAAKIVEREDHLHSQQSKLEEDRAVFLVQREEADKRSAELREASERLKEEKTQLRTQQDEFRTRQEEFLAQEESLEEERQAFRKEAEQFARDAEQAAVARVEFQARVQEIEKRQAELEEREAPLAERQKQIDVALERQHEQELTLAKERAEVERLHRELEERRRQIDKDSADLKAQATRNQADSARIQAEREALQAAQDDVRDQRVAVESARQHLEHDRQKTRETAKQVERDKKKYAELHAQYETDQRTLKIAREEAEAARSELRQQNEKFEAARVAFMEERAQVTKKEADIHKALKQLRDERKGLQPEEDTLKSWSLHQTPKETVADLQILLSRLQEDRHRLKVEREQLAEVFSLVSRGGRGGVRRPPRMLAEGTQRRLSEGPRLRMILEPGTASSGEVTDLLAELSALNRRLGGPGVEFLVNECRTWRVSTPESGAAAGGSPRPDAAKAPTDRSFVEIYAVPRKPSEPDAKHSAAHWDRFTASLFLVLRLDAGQANYFEMSEEASSEHPSFVLASDSARRAAEKASRLADPKNAAPADSSVDALNEHLRKIEELRRKLEREDSLILELAPAVELPAAEAVVEPAVPTVEASSSNRILVIAVGVVAAAALTIGGLFYALRGNPAAHDSAPASQSAPSN
ncbi:MAG TPA: hypothetical protein VHX68_01660, partial [Planctomycetaceae bacterium]|nr:hypothetical protein [Planctomycetaceae bacterium]